VNKSLIVRGDGQDGEPRFTMLETIRAYAAERLTAHEEEPAVRSAHASYFLDLVERDAPLPFLPDDRSRLALLDAEHANLRAAMSWFTGIGDGVRALRFAAALGWFWYVRGLLEDGRTWLEQALADGAAEHPALRVRSMFGLGVILMAQGELEASGRLLEDGYALATDIGDAAGAAFTSIKLGVLADAPEELEQARRHFEQALALAPSIPDARLSMHVATTALSCLGETSRHQGRFVEAIAYHEDALSQRRQARDTQGVMVSLADLGEVARDRGDLERALRYYRESLELAGDYFEPWSVATVLERIACMLAENGHAPRAVSLFATAERVWERGGIVSAAAKWSPADQVLYERGLYAARTALTDAAFDEAWDSGRSLSLTQAVVEATLPPGWATTTPAGELAETAHPETGLSTRELEVLSLIAAGRSNREIADTLFVSVHTVKTHVKNILAKLELDSRTAAAAYAHAHRLVPR
jgi:non-specific serine/threonine protein kinase